MISLRATRAAMPSRRAVLTVTAEFALTNLLLQDYAI